MTERHPHAGHPASAVLADHFAPQRTQSTAPTICDCRWTGPSCDHPAHLAEMLVRAGLLPEPDALRVILAGRSETHWGNVAPDGDHVPRATITDARRTFKSRGWPVIRRVTIEGPWEPVTDWAGLLKEDARERLDP